MLFHVFFDMNPPYVCAGANLGKCLIMHVNRVGTDLLLIQSKWSDIYCLIYIFTNLFTYFLPISNLYFTNFIPIFYQLLLFGYPLPIVY